MDLNISVKRRISPRARKNILSALTVFMSFAILYFALLFAVIRPSKEQKIYIPVSSTERLQSVKAPFEYSERNKTVSVPERAVPLYISEFTEERLPKETEISGFDKISVYFHESGNTSEMPFEEYVLCSLLAEMPTSYDPEALKAQAVACRTYAAYKALFCDKHEGGGALCTSSAHCQAFADISTLPSQRVEIAKKAVDDTKGIVMLYEGAPILAVFHAASVGSTRSSAEVWGGELPYLVPAKTSEDVFMNVSERRGHGVGMSQYGAQCLATEGYDFYAILSHYYKGITFGVAE